MKPYRNNRLFSVRILYRFLIGLDLLVSVFAMTPLRSDPDPFFLQVIEREGDRIKQISQTDYLALSDAYNCRAESYLILHCNEEALEDFSIAYEYASYGSCKESELLALRALFGSFFAYALLDDLANSRRIFDVLSPWISSYSSCEKRELSSQDMFIKKCSSREEPDYPILGPDRASIRECIERVDAVVSELNLLTAAIRQTPIRAMAITLVNQLGREAERCCYAGGLWKGCLQRLVNKLHYWNMLGTPTDQSYYTGIHFM